MCVPLPSCLRHCLCLAVNREAFATRYFEQATSGFFASADAAFVLAFSVIMLNTNQHSDQIKEDQASLSRPRPCCNTASALPMHSTLTMTARSGFCPCLP